MAKQDVADILIIGSGASGGVFAWHLSKVPGLKIVCLEQGDWTDPAQRAQYSRTPAPHPEAEAQRQRLTNPPPKKEGVRYWKDGYPYDHSDSYWTPILGNNVGGASVHYGAVWCRYHPSDFVARSLDGIGDNWPISYWDVEPYYDMLDEIVGVAGVQGNPALPPRKAKVHKAYPLSQSSEIMARGFGKLGWHWWATETAVITEPHNGRMPCPSNCEACDEGCSRRAKNSSDIVFWPDAIKAGVALRSRCRVREITVNKKGLADGAVYYDPDGKLVEQKAKIVVVAANGLGTPRLLLNSKSKLFPQGLANSSGLVGKNLMAHPMMSVSAVFEKENTAPKRYQSSGLQSMQFYESDPTRRGYARGFWWMGGGYSGPVRAALGEGPTPRATVVPAALQVGHGRPIQWGRLHHAAFQELYTHSAGLSILLEEIAHDKNYLELDPTITDDSGIPGIKLHFERTENLKKMMTFAADRSKEMFEAAGATKINPTTNLREGGAYHLMGTARMGNDPKTSVVDKFGCAHDVRNLWVIDGSQFVTAGSAVVTATLQALALRAADYVKNNINKLTKA